MGRNYEKAVLECRLIVGDQTFHRKYRPWKNKEMEQIIQLFFTESKGGVEYIDPLGRKSKVTFDLKGFTLAWIYCIKFIGYNPLEEKE